MKRIFEESGVGDVVINSRILNVFKKNISLLQTAYRRASKAGEKITAKVVERMENRTEISIQHLL